MKIRLIAALALVFASTVQANYDASAYGASPEEARKNALASLSESLVVHVKSEFKSVQTTDGNSSARQEIKTTSGLPLLGVEYLETKKSGEYFCEVLLSPGKVLPLYRSRIKDLAEQANQLDQQQRSQRRSEKYATLEALLLVLENLRQYQTVIKLLGANTPPDKVPSITSVRSQILSLESASPTLDIAATVLTRDLPDEVYLVQAPSPFGSSEATRLSRLIQIAMKQRLRSVDNQQAATSFLRGQYEIVDDGIVVSYQASNQQGEPQASRVVKIAPSAYQNVAYKPESIDFDKLLHEGYVVSSDFRAELNTNQGKTGLLFSGGQIIELFAKMNAPGYFYIVAHNEIEQLSYLVELNDAPGGRAFVRFVNADDANRWLSLGEFEVSSPFGKENLQLIASNKDLIDRLPSVRYDSNNELYIVRAKSLSSAVSQTRGLKPKKKVGVKSTEVTLTYTSME